MLKGRNDRGDKYRYHLHVERAQRRSRWRWFAPWVFLVLALLNSHNANEVYKSFFKSQPLVVRLHQDAQFSPPPLAAFEDVWSDFNHSQSGSFAHLPAQSTELSTISPDLSTSDTAQRPVRVLNSADFGMNKEQMIQALFLPMIEAKKTQALNPVQKTESNFENPTDAESAEKDPNEDEQEKELHPDEPAAEEMITAASSVGAKLVSGQLELAGGITSSTHLHVYRVDDEGQVQEQTWVSPEDPHYSLRLKSWNGQLIGEVHNARDGRRVVGRGILDLADSFERGLLLKGQSRLVIYPLTRTLKGRLGIFAGEKKPPTSPLFEVLGILAPRELYSMNSMNVSRPLKFELSQIWADSRLWALVRNKQGGWVNTLAYLPHNTQALLQGLQLRVLNESQLQQWLNEFKEKNIVKDANKSFNEFGLVWGRVVSQAGLPQEGSHVEVLTGDENIKPIYLNNNMKLDPNLKATAKNGMFAVFPFEPGVHVIRVESSNGFSTGPLSFWVARKAVTQFDVEVLALHQKMSSHLNSSLRSRDLNFKPLKISAYEMFDKSKKHFVEARGLGEIGDEETILARSASMQDPELSLKILPQPALTNYLDITAINPSKDNLGVFWPLSQLSISRVALLPEYGNRVEVPLIDREWISMIRNKHRITQEPNTGVVVGFVKGVEEFEARIIPIQKDLTTISKTIYFDRDGKGLRFTPRNQIGSMLGEEESARIKRFMSKDEKFKASLNKIGGGYIIFNVPEGPAMIRLAARGSVQTLPALVDSTVVSVILHRLQ